MGAKELSDGACGGWLSSESQQSNNWLRHLELA
jgi:hypothetical protein